MQVKDMMSSHLITVDREENVAAAARLLSRHNVGALPVTDGGRLVGMLTDRDIAVRCVAANFDPNLTRVRSVMSTGAVTISAEDSGLKAAQTMGRHQVRRLPVTSNGRLVGMLSQADLALGGENGDAVSKAFREVYEQYDSIT